MIMMPMIIKEWPVFIIFCLITFDNEAFARKRVCVIGAGRAGLAAVKKVADQIDIFEPIAFERNSDVGGLWIYRDDPEKDEHGMYAHSGIYKNLKTLSYIQTMVYPDYPDIWSDSKQTIVSHETFLEYMRNYTRHFHLRKYIQFNTLVTNVMPVGGECGPTRWLLKKRNLKTYNEDEIICDAVIVCSGRYSKPNIPTIPGIEQFSGRVLHSRYYRKPEDFTNKTVVVLGYGASGDGISQDLVEHAKTVYLSHSEYFYGGDVSESIKERAKVVAANGSILILQDKSTIAADAIIFCTGYLFDFPFLDARTGIETNGYTFHPLIKQYINKAHPTMAFNGMHLDTASPKMQYTQVEDFLESLKKMTLTTTNDLLFVTQAMD